MKKFLVLSLYAILFSGLFTGCEKKGTPPALPPAESMKIDFSSFAVGKKSLTIPGAAENVNWAVAATIAGIWNSLIVVNLAVPVASFEKAVSLSPSYIDNKTWQWKYSVNVAGAAYNARLTGQIRSDDVLWTMYISKDGTGSFPEFTWFTGTAALDGNSGTWTMNASHDDQTPLLQIDWTKSGENIATVKYTYVKTGESFTGSYIEYGLTSATLNAYYNVHAYIATKLSFVDVNIEWSTSAYNGRVKAPAYFEDENWHCWDSNGNDITCPAR